MHVLKDKKRGNANQILIGSCARMELNGFSNFRKTAHRCLLLRKKKKKYQIIGIIQLFNSSHVCIRSFDSYNWNDAYTIGTNSDNTNS